MITLSDGETTLELPYDLFWSDESWSPVVAETTRGLTGAAITQIGVRQAARPITLQPPPRGRGGWMRQALLTQLLSWRDAPSQELTLTLRGVAYTVRWRHSEPPALAWDALRHRADPHADDWVIPTFRFETVS